MMVLLRSNNLFKPFLVMSLFFVLVNCLYAQFNETSKPTKAGPESKLTKRAEHKLDLTEAEEIWLHEHPVIKIGIGESWAPFIFINDDDSIHGFDPDWVAQLNNVLGIQIELVPGKWHQIVKLAETKRIDGLASSAVTSGRSLNFNFSNPYNLQYYAIATTPDKISSFRSSDDLHGITLASLKGNVWIEKIVKDLQGVKRIMVESEAEAFKLVIEGKADASFITTGMFSEMQKIYSDNIQIAHVFEEDKYRLDLVYSIRKDWPEFIPILNKAIDKVGEAKNNELFRKWFGTSKEDFVSWLELTKTEIDWLRKNPILRLAPDPEFYPVEWLDESGNYYGIAAEFMGLIAKQLKIQLEVVHPETWDESIQLAKARKIDILPAAVSSLDRLEYMNSTKPYLDFPVVLVTSEENRDYNKLSKLKDKKLAIVKSHVWVELIRRDYPEINVIEVENITEGLIMSSNSDVEAFLIPQLIASYYIKQEGIADLKISGITKYKSKLSILTRKDKPILNTIMNKALQQIPQNKRDEIISKWVYLEQEPIYRSRFFWVIILSALSVFGLIILVITIWNKSLKKQVKLKTAELHADIKKRKTAEEKLAASEEKYKLLIKNQLDMLAEIDAKGRFLFVNPAFCEAFGKKAEDILGTHVLKLIYKRDIHIIKDVLKTLNQPPHTCYTEYRAHTAKGIRWLGWTKRAILNSDGKLFKILGLGRDITKQKETEIQITKIAKEWENTFDAANDAFWILNKDQVIIRSNKAAAKMFAAPFEDIIGKQCWEIVHNTNEPIEFCPMCRSKQSLKRETMELRDGDKYYLVTVDPIISETGEFEGAVHIVSDITTRKKMELELEEYRSNLEELVKDRTAELVEKNEKLKHFNQLFVGREFRIKELKDKLRKYENIEE